MALEDNTRREDMTLHRTVRDEKKRKDTARHPSSPSPFFCSSVLNAGESSRRGQSQTLVKEQALACPLPRPVAASRQHQHQQSVASKDDSRPARRRRGPTFFPPRTLSALNSPLHTPRTRRASGLTVHDLCTHAHARRPQHKCLVASVGEPSR